MRHLGRASVVGALLALLWAGCAAGRAASRPGVVAGHDTRADVAVPLASADDAHAAALLAEALVRHPEQGLQVLTVGSDGLGVARGRHKFLLQPRMLGPGKENKVVVTQLYAVKEAVAAKPDQLAELCFEVNTTMPFLHASIQSTPRGPLFVAKSELTFGDVLYLDRLAAYLDRLKFATLSKGGARLAHYVK